MSQDVSDAQRRVLLQAVAGLTGTAALGLPAVQAGVLPPLANGKPGDFDFLTGEWTIQNRRLNGTTWEEFPGEATVWGLLGGVASVEELRIPSRNFSGMGLRLLDVEQQAVGGLLGQCQERCADPAAFVGKLCGWCGHLGF
ncbi:MAG: hypothetical protein CFE43_16115 [Burkholderiales bacterium PBB3]|nr:MAG: hypothetical protein CFE43_16115 [Burkholderiales bacterium PBB3]